MGGKLSWMKGHVQGGVPCGQENQGGGSNPPVHPPAPDMNYDVTAGSVARRLFLHARLLPVSANNEVIQLAVVYI